VAGDGRVGPETTWKHEHRHWHCTAVEGPIGQRLEIKPDEQHAAHSPEEVLAWMEREVGRLRARLTQDGTGGADRVVLDAELRRLHLERLAAGRSAGAFVPLAGERILALDALAVTSADCPDHHQVS
jgi:hypothetical protein